MRGLESKFCEQWEWCDEVSSGLQFIGCIWTEYTKSILPDWENYDILYIDTETAKVVFYYNESSTLNKVFDAELRVVDIQK